MHLSQHKLCTRKIELALEVKFHLEFHWVTRPWWQTLANGRDVKDVFPQCLFVLGCAPEEFRKKIWYWPAGWPVGDTRPPSAWAPRGFPSPLLARPLWRRWRQRSWRSTVDGRWWWWCGPDEPGDEKEKNDRVSLRMSNHPDLVRPSTREEKIPTQVGLKPTTPGYVHCSVGGAFFLSPSASPTSSVLPKIYSGYIIHSSFLGYSCVSSLWASRPPHHSTIQPYQ